MASFRLVAFNEKGQLVPPTGTDTGLVQLLAIGTEQSYTILNQANLDSLLSLISSQDADSLHHHDSRYFTKLELTSTDPSSTGASRIMAKNPYGGFSNVQQILEALHFDVDTLGSMVMEWQNSVITTTLLAPPLNPVTGNRYLLGLSIFSAPSGAWNGFGGHIAEWTGLIWKFTEPSVGMFISADDVPGRVYYFNGISWLEQTFENNSGFGYIDITAGVVSLKNLGEKSLIVGDENNIAVNVDTGLFGQIEATKDGLFVKDLALFGGAIEYPEESGLFPDNIADKSVTHGKLEPDIPGHLLGFNLDGDAVSLEIVGDVKFEATDILEARTIIQPLAIKSSMVDWGSDSNQIDDSDIPANNTPINYVGGNTLRTELEGIDSAIGQIQQINLDQNAEDLTFLKLDGSRAMTGTFDAGNQTIVNIAEIRVSNIKDQMNNAAIDLSQTDALRLARKIVFTGGTKKIENLADGTTSTDAINFGQLSAINSFLQSEIAKKLDKDGDTMSGSLDMGSNKITNLSNGTVAGDAVNLSQLNSVQNSINATISNLTTSDIAESGNLYYTDERVDDRVSSLIQNGTGLTWTYDDNADTYTGNVSLSPFSTTNLSEGSNLYFTEARVRSTPLTGLSTTTPGPITATDSVLVAMGKLQNSVTSNASTAWKVSGNTLASHGVIGSNSASFHVTLRSEDEDYALLSNNVFEIFKSIVPSPDQALALGTLASAFNNTYTKSVNFSQSSTSYGTIVGSATGLEILQTGPGLTQKLTARTISQYGETAAIEVKTGNSTVAGDSGNILLQTGTVLSGSRGTIQLDAAANGALLVNAPTGAVGLAVASVGFVQNEVTNNAANRSLSNLSSVAINTNLLPDTNATHDLGSNTLRFRDLYLSGNSIFLGSLKFTDNAGSLLVEDVDSPGIPAISTDNIAEGSSNLYYTNARVDARIGNASIENLSNVGDISLIEDGETLVWDSLSGEFIPGSSSSLDYTVLVATEGGSYTSANNVVYLFLNPASDLNIFSVTLPSSPKNGQEFSISSGDKGIISFAINPAAGQSIMTGAGAVGLPANSRVKYKWINSLSKWILADKSPFVTEITHGFERETKVISAAQVSSKSVTLLRAPVKPEIATVEFYGGTRQFYGVDYTIVGNVLQWTGLGLDGFIEENDIIEIRY